MGVTVDAIRARMSENIIPHQYDDGREWAILGYDQNAPSKYEEPTRPQSDRSASYP
jgi:hypothetical protein